MNSVKRKISFSICAALPLIAIGSTASTALAAALAAAAGLLLSLLCEFAVSRILPERSCAAAGFISLAAGVCAVGIISGVPYCALAVVPAVLLRLKANEGGSKARSAAVYCLVFAAVCVLFGILRETLGSGRIFGARLFSPPLPFLATPAGGLCLFAAALAVFRTGGTDDD